MVLIAAVCLVLGFSAEPPRDFFAPPVPEPLVIASESAAYVLTIVPRNADFEGPAPMTLTKHGQEVWTQEREFTLCGGCVTNDGRILGYAYDHGFDDRPGDPTNSSQGHLLIVFLNANGSIDERHEFERQSINIIADPPVMPTPHLLAVVPAESEDEVIFRVRVRWRTTPRKMLERTYDDEWWRFGISDGSLIERITPAHLSAEKPSTDFWMVVKEVVIPGTRYVLVHERRWNREKGEGRSDGARLSVVDFHGHRVWLRDDVDEYKMLESNASSGRDQIRAQLAFRDHAFSFTSLATGQTHWFAIEKTDDELGVIVIELPGPPSTSPDQP